MLELIAHAALQALDADWHLLDTGSDAAAHQRREPNSPDA
jgi:hypothetical protein